MEGKWRDEKASWHPVFLHYIGCSSSAPWGDAALGRTWYSSCLYWDQYFILGIKISSAGNNTIGGAIEYEEKRK